MSQKITGVISEVCHHKGHNYFVSILLLYHVEIGKRSPGGPVHGSGFDSLDPQVVGEHERENGDTLVVVRSGHRSGNVTGNDCNEGGRKKSGASRPQLLGEEVGRDGCQTTEERCQENANVSNVGRDVQVGEGVVDRPGGDHQAGVDGSTDDSAQWVPRPVVEPV